MNISDELSKLETRDSSEAQRLIHLWKKRLNDSRPGELDLLSEVIHYQLSTQSKTALNIILSLKDLYSQDFFAIINDCLHKQNTCLSALRLLSHMLTGQVSWVYKMVHSIVFLTLLKLLRPSTDIVIVTSAVYVLCGLIPLSPYHVTPHLPDIFESFTQLASLTTDDLSQELLLIVKVSVYYLFLQLYALFPCSFIQYLKGRFGPTGEVHVYQEHIAPLFQHVQLHPNLIVEVPSQETQRTRWSSKDPNEIATLSLSLCIDYNIVPNDTTTADNEPTEGNKEGGLSSLIPLSVDQKYCGLQANINDSLMANIVTPTMTTPTSLSEPVSLDSSLQTTPLFTKVRRRSPLFNYSPTASVEHNDPPDTTPTAGRSLSDRISNLFLRKKNEETTPTLTPSLKPHPLHYSHTPSPPVSISPINAHPNNAEETVLLASQKLEQLIQTTSQPVYVCKSVLEEKREQPVISSPLAALDVFINSGRVLHTGSRDVIPLTDLEGINWNYYGCCPHTQELSLMNQLVQCLHSQLLYERHQCMLHAKKNRRLMTKCRNVSKLENEIVSLRHQLHTQDELVQCLKKENEEEKRKQQPELSVNIKQLQFDKKELNEQIEKLQQEMKKLKLKNKHLSQELSDSHRVVFSLDNVVNEMKRKLHQGFDVKNELQSLTNEHLLLEELYHQQKLTLATLRYENTHKEQTKQLNESLAKDKERATSALVAVKREVDKLNVLIREKDEIINEKEKLITSLKKSLLESQEKNNEKIKVLESKYQSIKTINKELEESLLTLRTVRKIKHKRNDSTTLEN